MKKDWLYYLACILLPHIMLILGLVYLAKQGTQNKLLGKKLCILSTIVLIAGSLAYYIFFTPIFGLD